MNILQFFRRPTVSSGERDRPAAVARERLQILLAHERASAGQEGLVATLREEILAVIGKHVMFERDKVQVTVERNGETSLLEIEVPMPPNPRAEVALRA
jgi:cell division topological specificity factor